MCSLEGLEGFTKAEKQCRRVILYEEDSEVRNFVLNLKQFLIGKQIDVTALFKYMADKGTYLTGYEFDFASPKITVRPLDEQTYLGIEYFVDHLIKINRRPLPYHPNQMIEQTQQSVKELENIKQEDFLKQEQNQNSTSHKDRTEDQHKKKKEKQRKIKNAIECVKVWRGMYEGSRHKVSLMEAAKMMKISKKSLDDYFLQIRLGELYGFDFIKNFNKGIGTLRAFVKANSNKQMQSNVPKAIKSYELVRQYEQLKTIIIPEEDISEDKIHEMHLQNQGPV